MRAVQWSLTYEETIKSENLTIQNRLSCEMVCLFVFWRPYERQTTINGSSERRCVNDFNFLTKGGPSFVNDASDI